MAFTIFKGKARYCKVQPGGIDKVYVLNRFDANRVIRLDATNGVLDSTDGMISLSGTDDATTFYQFDCDPYLSALTQTIIVNEGGGVAYQQDLELVLKGVIGEADVTIENLSNGTWQMMVLDNTGTIYFCGLDKGMICTGGTFGHGGDKVATDNLSYTLTFSATELAPALNCGALSNVVGQDVITISGTQITG